MREAEMLRRTTLGMGMFVVLMTSGCSSVATSDPPIASPLTAASPAPSAAPAGSAAASDVAASVAIDCAEETTGCAGPLSPGEHRSAQFERPFSFTIPDGWTNDRDIYRAYALRASVAPTAEFLVWTRSAPAKQTPDCSPARREGFGTSVSEWLRSLTTDERLDVKVRETFQLGSHAATRVEVMGKPEFGSMCPDNTDPFVVLVTDTEIPPTRHHSAGGSMTLVDFGDDAVVIWNDGGDVSLERMLELSLPIIHTIRFD